MIKLSYMAYRRRKRESDDDPTFRLVFSLLALYLIWMVGLYLTNRTAYWQWLGLSIVFVVVILGIVIGALKFLANKKKKKLDSILSDLKQNGLEGDVNNFIDSFGLEKKTGKPWRYDRSSFSWEQMERFRKILNEKGMHLSTDKWDDLSFLLKYYIEEKADRFMRDSMSVAPRKFTDLSGSEFENPPLRLFGAMGFSADLIGGTGDQGGDLVVNMGNDRVVVQAKCYANSVGNAAVQQANAAKAIYNCSKAMVVTNSNFTKEAFVAARAMNVELVDGGKLSGWLFQYLKQNWK